MKWNVHFIPEESQLWSVWMLFVPATGGLKTTGKPFLIQVRGKFETIEFSDGHGPLAAFQKDLEQRVSAVVRRELEQTVRRAQELGPMF